VAVSAGCLDDHLGAAHGDLNELYVPTLGQDLVDQQTQQGAGLTRTGPDEESVTVAYHFSQPGGRWRVRAHTLSPS
jgi:hypothetical protein